MRTHSRWEALSCMRSTQKESRSIGECLPPLTLKRSLASGQRPWPVSTVGRRRSKIHPPAIREQQQRAGCRAFESQALARSDALDQHIPRARFRAYQPAPKHLWIRPPPTDDVTDWLDLGTTFHERRVVQSRVPTRRDEVASAIDREQSRHAVARGRNVGRLRIGKRGS